MGSSQHTTQPVLLGQGKPKDRNHYHKDACRWANETILNGGNIMNAVQEIKQRHDMGILLRAIAPAARKRQEPGARKRWGRAGSMPPWPAGAFPSAWYEGAVYRICRRCKQRWNVSAIAPGDKVYFCPRCESKHKIAEWTKISRMNGRTSNAS